MATNYKSHAKCRLTFRPNERPRNEVEYSDRTVIELREGDDLTVTLLAKDVPKANEIIFNMKLNRKDQYRQGRSEDDPDEIRCTNGTYLAVLDGKDRDKFHTALQECFLLIETFGGDPVDSAPPPRDADQGRDRDRRQDSPRRDRDREQDRDRRDNPPARNDDRDRDRRRDRDREQERDRRDKPPARNDDRDRDRQQERDRRDNPPPRNDDQQRDRRRDSPRRRESPSRRDREQEQDRPRNSDRTPTKQETVLSNINQLVESIKRGDGREAGRLAGLLASQRVRLQEKENTDDSEQATIPIRVTIDRANSKQQDDLIIDVYPSTTVRELRAAFEYSHQIRPVDQYWFVNGHLAYEGSSMKELQAVKDTLFVLFTV